jgi:DNA-binding IclR family transcriptional regulator
MAEMSKTVDQAMLLLAELRAYGPGTPTELSRRLEMSRTVATRLLSTLEKHGQVRRSKGSYALGFGLLDLASVVALDLRDSARPALMAMSRELGETSVLAVREGFEAVAIDQFLPDQRLVRVDYRPGSRHRLHEAAHGRAILAWCQEDLVERVLQDAEDPALGGELEAVRDDGFAVSQDELEEGVVGVAAPIFSPRGVVIASIGVVAPAGRLQTTELVTRAVLAAAASVGRQPISTSIT